MYPLRDIQEQLEVDGRDTGSGTGVSGNQLSQRNHSPGARLLKPTQLCTFSRKPG